MRTLEIIGVDRSGGYFTHSYDNAGNAGTYSAKLEGKNWTIDGESERFSGSFTDDRNQLSGTWTRSEDGRTWMPWLRSR